MASGAMQVYFDTLTGAAADITVAKVPFRPRIIRILVNTGAGHIEHGYKNENMSGSAYLSTTTGIDAGVTITDTGFTLANGADVNINGYTVHYECWG